MSRLMRFVIWGWFALPFGFAVEADEPRDAAMREMERAIEFYHGQVSSHGGYVYLYSADLTKREGEGRTTTETVWVQPPGTPAVGEALLRAYLRTGNPAALAAARDAAACLLQGQYRSGGWNASIEFEPRERAKHAYRVDPPAPKKRQRNISSLDDDKTQSALRFLMRLDRALKFEDVALHTATLAGLEALLHAQFPNGAWAQVWEGPADATLPADLKARFPAEWPRTYPGGDYWFHYTFNDNNISRVVETLWLAAAVYDDDRYRQAARRAGDFILAAQLPEPQPAWAQQYNVAMEPVWARKFEPPAVSGSESQALIGTLMDLAVATGDRKYLEPIPRALAYLRRSVLPDGRLARFYELETNRPLYLTREYELTYEANDLPTHYGFLVEQDLAELTKRFETLQAETDWRPRPPTADLKAPRRVTADFEREIAGYVKALDDRGAWVEAGRLSYHGKDDPTRDVISSKTFIQRLDRLAEYLSPRD
jgi:hypothetical protein